MVDLQVNIVQLQLLQTYLQGIFDVVNIVIVDLGGHKELLTLNAGLLDPGSKLLFCLVHWVDL